MIKTLSKRTVVSLALATMMGSGAAMAANDPIKLGAIYITSGSAATYGEFGQQGIQLAVDEINSAGGVLGRQIEFQVEDSEGKAAVAIQAARKLVYQENVDALLGLDSSGVAQGLVPVLPELETPLIITHAATPDVTGALCNPYTYRVSVNVLQNMMGAATIAADTGIKKWTTIGPDYAFGHQSWEFFSKYLKEKNPGVELSSSPSFPRFGAEDFTPFINSVMEAKPEGVLISLWGGDLVNFIRQANTRGFFDQGFTVLMSVGAATEVLITLGDQMPENVWLGTRYWYDAHDNDMNKKFVNSYREKYNTVPSYNAEGAYVAVYAYKQAIEKAGSSDGTAIAEALSGSSVETPTGTLTFRKGDNQALIGPTWGRSAEMNDELKIRTLVDVKTLSGEESTPPVDPACKM